jgi:DNA repair protein RecN (Recombination protein N)
LKTIDSAFLKLSAVFPKAGELAERIKSAALELKDIAAEIAAEAERVGLDPEKLERTEQRLDLLYSLQQKHRVSDVADLIVFHEDILSRLARSEGFDARIGELETEISRLQSSAAKNAEKISKNRQAVSGKVEKHVAEICAQLGMPNVRFSVEVTLDGELGIDGTNSVRFLFTANKNAPLQPVEQVASGGEMSRLMLALKSLVARHRQLPTLIFDEIDTGISGEIAHRTGEIIRGLATHLQVINITHLPQVASKGDHHYLVYKEEDARATNIRIRLLTTEERVMEIAKMLSGSAVSSAAMEQARLLLRQK